MLPRTRTQEVWPDFGGLDTWPFPLPPLIGRLGMCTRRSNGIPNNIHTCEKEKNGINPLLVKIENNKQTYRKK